MDDHRLTRSYLETLSTDDLASLADQLGLDLPLQLSRSFVIEELLEESDDGDDESEENPLEEVVAGEKSRPVENLPSNYNETFIGVLLRDPLWAYAFWEVKASDREACQRRDGFAGYRLRVVALLPSRPVPDGSSFTIAVGEEDSAWYLSLPAGGAVYRVDLCAQLGRSEEVLASSAPFTVPRGRVSPKVSVHSEGVPDILALSGLHELAVLQNSERPSRMPHHSAD